MIKGRIIYQSKEEIFGKHLRYGEWIYYTGDLTIYDRENNPIVLKLKSEIADSILGEVMEEKKEIKGTSVSEVFGKVAKWFYNRGVIFQN
ncbi:MAG: hypothetical protein WAW07_15680 [Bacteroidales bacterium]